MSNAVNPGWDPTRMGGHNAPDDINVGAHTQAWLATSDEADTGTGGYWYHGKTAPPAPAVHDVKFLDHLLQTIAQLTGEPFRRTES